jgi:glycosyltransferase involved in cell wall biosynthesis
VRVLVLVKAYAPAEFPTGAQQAHQFVRELRAGGVDVRVVTTDGNGANALDVATGRWTERDGVPVYYGRRIPRTSDLSWDAWRSFHRESRAAELIHVMGMFSWINLAAASASRRRRAPVVVSPRGMLNPEALAFSRWKKAVYFRLGGSRALDETAGFHVTSEKERDNVAKLLPRARIAVIPNGVVVPSDDDLAGWAREQGDAPTVLFVGRIHPIKNVIPLVRAWASVLPRHPGANLVLAGPDDHGHKAEVERTIASLGIGAGVRLPGYVGGEALSRLLATSACLVLPSVAENFGNVVAEALAHRRPVVASTGTPWSALRDRGCGWWIEPTVEGLAGAIDAALSITLEERAAMGERGRRWMIEAFSWSSFASRMAELYRALVVNAG